MAGQATQQHLRVYSQLHSQDLQLLAFSLLCIWQPDGVHGLKTAACCSARYCAVKLAA